MNRLKHGIYILFAIYILFLIWAVLFKFSFSYTEIPFKRRYINLKLFSNVSTYFTSQIIIEKILNIIIFLPFGAYLYYIGVRRIIPVMFIVLFSSIAFETIQYIFALGTSDIADVATNLCGGCFGYFYANMAVRIAKNEEKALKHYIILASVMSIFIPALTVTLKLSGRI